MFVVLLTGPPGAGKSAVLASLHDALGDEDVSGVALEVDELQRAYPPLAADRTLAHVAALSHSFREAGYGLLLLSATVETSAHLRDLLDATGAGEHLVVRLEALPATLERRLTAREPVGWSGLPALIARSHRLASSMVTLEGVNLVLSTEDDRPEQVAAAIEAALRDAPRRGPRVASTG
jgi:adenylate kinase family enzyme